MSTERPKWHLIDARSKGVVKFDGLKIEFDSHQDALIGLKALNALEERIAELETALEEIASAESDDPSYPLWYRARRALGYVDLL